MIPCRSRSRGLKEHPLVMPRKKKRRVNPRKSKHADDVDRDVDLIEQAESEERAEEERQFELLAHQVMLETQPEIPPASPAGGDDQDGDDDDDDDDDVAVGEENLEVEDSLPGDGTEPEEYGEETEVAEEAVEEEMKTADPSAIGVADAAMGSSSEVQDTQSRPHEVPLCSTFELLERDHGRPRLSACGKVTITMKPGQTLVFHGSVRVAMDDGFAEVFGHKLTPHVSSYDLYSPAWDPRGLLCIRCTGDSSCTMTLESCPSRFLVEKHVRQEQSSDAAAGSHPIMSIDGFFPVSRSLHFSPLRTDSWEQTAASVCANLHPTVAVCGARNTGKSTFTRFIINRLLCKFDQVAYLDTDLGQSEFTPPGFVSLSLVRTPVLGPPHTHLQQPVCSVFVGDVTVSDSLQRYLDAVRYCFHAYEQTLMGAQVTEGCPLVVNTHGWVTGVGLDALVGVISSVSISMRRRRGQHEHEHEHAHVNSWHVVELMDPASTERKIQTPSDVERALEAPLSKSGVVWSQVHRPADKNRVVGSELTSAKQRLLSLASYLAGHCTRHASSAASHGYNYGLGGASASSSSVVSAQRAVTPFSLATIGQLLGRQTPRVLPFSSVSVCVAHAPVQPTEVLVSLNCALVGLCVSSRLSSIASDEKTIRVLPEVPACDCLGLGLIRNIDVQKGLFYIVTPLSVDELRRVNVIQRGSIETASLLMYQAASDATLLHSYSALRQATQQAADHTNTQSAWDDDVDNATPYLTFKVIADHGTGARAMKTRKNVQRRRLQ